MLRHGLAWLFEALAGGGMIRPRGVREGDTARVTVLSPGPIPTTDYYFHSRLDRPGAVPANWVDTREHAPAPGCIEAGSDVVIVRFAPRAWLRWLRVERPRLRRVVLFIDDDMPQALRAQELPFSYALRTAYRFASTRRLLQPLCDELWVSTAELARRYAAADPRVVPPLYVEGPEPAATRPVYFYHGTGAHRREVRWLRPVVREVQRRMPEARFDLVGDEAVKRLYRGIPGVTVRPQTGWPRYRDLAGREGFQLGLAPCLPGLFNAARAHVKLFDITRLGAAGIYSRAMPYDAVVEHGRTGWLCENREECWVEEITRRLADAPGCRALHARALAWCRESSRNAGGLP